MSEWVKSCLSNISTILSEIGRGDLLSSFQRIREVTDLDEQEMMRFSESEAIAIAILEADTHEDLAAVLPMLAAYLGAEHATLHVVSEGKQRHFSRRVVTTYPDAWVRQYMARRYTFIDPVMRACASGPVEFFWDDLVANTASISFWADAKAHGIGTAGFSRCLPGPHSEDVVAVSMCSGENPATIRAAIQARRDDLDALLPLLGDRFRQIDHGATDLSVTLTHDQLLLLRAIADGAEFDDQRATDASMPRSSQEILRALGAKSLAQAAVIAAQIGLLANLPFSERDVHRSELGF